MNVGSLFSGDGLLDYGLHLAGWGHGFLCESEPDRRAVLSLRWPGVPIYEDVREVDGSAPRIDLLAGGFPCKGGSTAGKREGLGHPETALWREMARVIGELRPRLVLLENVANLLAIQRGGAWGEVLGDLASLGYVGGWDCLPAAAFGAPHFRDRVFCVAADANQSRAHAYAAAGSKRSAIGERTGAPADAAHLRPERAGPSRSGRDGSANGDATSPDSSRDAEGGAGSSPGTHGERARSGDHADVGWGRYEPAIRRWERLHGPAPQPLIRGVDDRSAARVVRSRLSALGDGVLVQAGYFLGHRLMALNAERTAA